ncbi:MAG: hypothetical protein J7497_13060, partial [Chitinophagaceae bacterium]|nr:hypothetical protein [Chitinophagaceae bacterium]
MLIRFLSVITLVFLTAARTFSQFQDKVPQIKPVPPDAASLFKTLERPIGNFTGTVPVNFPLFSLKSGTLSADLSLSYNSTGGIKVEEAAGSVGLGFSLADGGGRITQMINGKPDDLTGGFLNAAVQPSDFSCTNTTHLNSVYENQLDLEPDQYMYSFNGRSGKFFLKEDGSVVLMDNASIKIEYSYASPSSNGIRQWIITDEEGNKYYFGSNKAKTIDYKIRNGCEYTSLTNGSTSGSTASASWFLTEAYDMNETNSLKFTYQLANTGFVSYSGGFMVLYFNNTSCA